MKPVDFAKLLSGIGGPAGYRLGLFALLNLGVVELLANGALSAVEATRGFYNAENCLYVRKHLRDKTADKIMSHAFNCKICLRLCPEEKRNKNSNANSGLSDLFV